MEEITYIGYHGTKIENANQIIATQRFIPGDDEENEDFLGKGIYFFSNYQHSVFWNLRMHKIETNKIPKYDEYIDKYSILETLVSANRENILDLEDVADLVKYDKICNKFKEIFTKNGEFQQYNTAKNKDKAILNFLYKNNLMDDIYIVRKIFHQKLNVNDINLAKDIKKEMICIKNDIVIKYIDILKNINEDEYDNFVYLSFPPQNRYV